MSTITTRQQNTIDVMTTAARMYGRRSSRTRLEGYPLIAKLLEDVDFSNKESVKSTFKNIANVLKSNGLGVEKWYAPVFYFEAQARETGLEPIEWVRGELMSELFPEPKAAPEQPKAAPEQPKAAPEQPKAAPEQPKAAPEQPKAAPEQPKAAPEQPKAAPEQPKAAPEQPKKAEDVSFIDYLDESGFEKLSSNLNITLTESERKSLMDKINMLTIGDLREVDKIPIEDIISSSIEDNNAAAVTEADMVTAVLTKIKESVGHRKRVAAVLEDAAAIKIATACISTRVAAMEALSVHQDLSVHDPDPSKSRGEKVKFIEEKIKVSDDFMSSAFKIDESADMDKINMLYNMLTSDELANMLRLKYGFAGTSADIELTAVPVTRYPGQPARYKFAFEIGPKGFKKKAKKRKIVILYNPEPVKASGSITIDRRIGYAEQFTATV